MVMLYVMYCSSRQLQLREEPGNRRQELEFGVARHCSRMLREQPGSRRQELDLQFRNVGLRTCWAPARRDDGIGCLVMTSGPGRTRTKTIAGVS